MLDNVFKLKRIVKRSFYRSIRLKTNAMVNIAGGFQDPESRW